MNPYTRLTLYNNYITEEDLRYVMYHFFNDFSAF